MNQEKPATPEPPLDSKLTFAELINRSFAYLPNEQLAKTMKKIQSLLNCASLKFARPGDNHELHDMVTDITLHARKIPQLQNIWRIFLDKIHGTTVSCANNVDMMLDFSPEKKYLEHPNLLPGRIIVEKINRTDQHIKRVFQEIYQIDQESFCIAENPHEISKKHLNNDDFSFFVARDEMSNRVEGYMVVEKEKDPSRSQPQWYIFSVARRANAAKRGVSQHLFQELINNQNAAKMPIVLDVRIENDSAIKAYKKLGFEIIRTKANYYFSPRGDAFEMKRHA